MAMSRAVATRDIKLVDIGNSRGIRLPKALLQKYGWSDSLVLEETESGIFLRGRDETRLSWTETYRSMAAEPEDWSDMETTVADGLD
jgi:antitoxin MazE